MSEEDVVKIVNEVIALFIDNNCGTSCFIGYSRAEYQGDKMRVLHYWVEIEEGVAYIDIGKEVLRYTTGCSKKIGDYKFIFGESIPPNSFFRFFYYSKFFPSHLHLSIYLNIMQIIRLTILQNF